MEEQFLEDKEWWSKFPVTDEASLKKELSDEQIEYAHEMFLSMRICILKNQNSESIYFLKLGNMGN